MKAVKYGSEKDIKGFDFLKRLKCWISGEHYYMSPDINTQEWCGHCGKRIKNL